MEPLVQIRMYFCYSLVRIDCPEGLEPNVQKVTVRQNRNVFAHISIKTTLMCVPHLVFSRARFSCWNSPLFAPFRFASSIQSPAVKLSGQVGSKFHAFKGEYRNLPQFTWIFRRFQKGVRLSFAFVFQHTYDVVGISPSVFFS